MLQFVFLAGLGKRIHVCVKSQHFDSHKVRWHDGSAYVTIEIGSHEFEEAQKMLRSTEPPKSKMKFKELIKQAMNYPQAAACHVIYHKLIEDDDVKDILARYNLTAPKPDELIANTMALSTDVAQGNHQLSESRTVQTYKSLQHDGYYQLEFFSGWTLMPVSGSEWTRDQIKALNLKDIKFSTIQEFLAHIVQSDFLPALADITISLSPQASRLLELLDKLKQSTLDLFETVTASVRYPDYWARVKHVNTQLNALIKEVEQASQRKDHKKKRRAKKGHKGKDASSHDKEEKVSDQTDHAESVSSDEAKVGSNVARVITSEFKLTKYPPGVDDGYNKMVDVINYVNYTHRLFRILFLMDKYGCESLTNLFVYELLSHLNYCDGWLNVLPELHLDLTYGTKNSLHAATVRPDLTVLDLISFFRMCVIEDKSIISDEYDGKDKTENEEEEVSTALPQVIAEAIACLQQNIRISKDKTHGTPLVSVLPSQMKDKTKRKSAPSSPDDQKKSAVTFSSSTDNDSEEEQSTSKTTHSSSKEKQAIPYDLYADDFSEADYLAAGPLLALVVRGRTFWFTYIPASSVRRLLLKMKFYRDAHGYSQLVDDDSPIPVYVFKNQDNNGFDFVNPDDRKNIVELLDKFGALMRLAGEQSRRRKSFATKESKKKSSSNATSSSRR
jgi:hypothetical protein